jgi:hypothetical protein
VLTADFCQREFARGLAYEDYVATGNPDQRRHWRDFFSQARLTDGQQRLLAGFSREMKVLVVSGVWCGDCVQQCPLLARIAAANPACIQLRFFDRDRHAELSGRLRICGGARVPVAVFVAEDFEFCSLAGDRTLARYRALAARQLGPSCPLPGAAVPADEVAATLQDWVDEFERVQLMLRLSGRLRQKHGD